MNDVRGVIDAAHSPFWKVSATETHRLLPTALPALPFGAQYVALIAVPPRAVLRLGGVRAGPRPSSSLKKLLQWHMHVLTGSSKLS